MIPALGTRSTTLQLAEALFWCLPAIATTQGNAQGSRGLGGGQPVLHRKKYTAFTDRIFKGELKKLYIYRLRSI